MTLLPTKDDIHLILISFSKHITDVPIAINSMYLQNDIYRLLFSPLYYNCDKKKNYNK